jgi:hypothetical protein
MFLVQCAPDAASLKLQNRQLIANRARDLAYNPVTLQWEQRVGTKKRVAGRDIWFSNRYRGPGYVQMPNGVFCEIPEDKYGEVFNDLMSGVENREQAAIFLILEIANAIGVMDEQDHE